MDWGQSQLQVRPHSGRQGVLNQLVCWLQTSLCGSIGLLCTCLQVCSFLARSLLVSVEKAGFMSFRTTQGNKCMHALPRYPARDRIYLQHQLMDAQDGCSSPHTDKETACLAGF